MKSSWLLGVLSAGIVFFFAGLLQAELIDVDFSNNSAGAAHGGPNPGPTMSGAAVLGAAGDQWNAITNSSGSGVSLFYADGSASTVTMTFTSDGGYDVYSYGGSTPFNGTPYGALMEDYLFNGGVAQTITLSGLATNAIYNLVLYNAADIPATGRETFFTVNGNTQSSTWDGASSTLIAGVNYVNFPTAASDGSGSLVITYTGNGSVEGDIDGFQIGPPPPPTVTITSPANGTVFAAPANVAIVANAVVSSGSVTNVVFFTNAVSLGSAQTAPFTINASDLAVGAYALTAVATAAGISATSTVVNVSVAVFQTNNTAAYTWTTLAGRATTGSADGVGSAVQFDGTAGVAVDTGGNIYVTDSGNNTIRRITAAGVSSTIAGFPGTSGTNDGEGINARFFNPDGIAVDSMTNLFVADTHNNRIRKMTPMGSNWMVSTIAGSGSIYAGSCDSCPSSGGDVDGAGTIAQFSQPEGIAVDSAGNLYVADSGNSAIRRITLAGSNDWLVSTIATNAQFRSPYGVAVDNASNIYVADTYNEEIREITPVGSSWVVSTLAGNGTLGSADGTGAAARFFKPVGIVVGSFGALYVTDQINDTLRKITPPEVVSTLAGSAQMPGSVDGTGATARFSNPFGVAVDGSGNLYVADGEEIRKITSAGVVKTLVGLAVGTGSADGTGSTARFNNPVGMAVDSVGNVDVADAGNYTIRQISSAGVSSTVAGLAGIPGAADGTGGDARFGGPGGVALNSGGALFVTDSGNSTIREITPAGVVTTIAGLAGSPGSADGIGSAARFSYPSGIAVGGSVIYVADTYNNCIRRIVPKFHFVPPGISITTWTVTTIAGLAGSRGSADGTGSAAQFFNPSGLVVDTSGNIYVADTDSQEIRKMTPVGTDWVVTTIAGMTGVNGSTDGLGTGALFNGPTSIAIDGAGNLYVADQYNSTVRKLVPVGTSWLVSTIGGLPGSYASQDGAGSGARFDEPDGIAVDSSGNVYVSDSWNNTIRKGVFTAYGPASKTASTPPPMNGQLTITLLPPQANGQWRFPWEVAWRDSGQTASNLAADNYTVEFRDVPGWLPIPASLTAVVTNGSSTRITNQYFPTIRAVDANIGGTLSVTLGSSPPSGAGWRFIGDTTPYYPSGYSTNLLPGTYLIEFAPVNGRVIPPNLSVQVQAGLTTSLSEDYLLPEPPPAQVLLPTLVPPSDISDLADYPFGFNGQLQSDVGYGSGVAVETNVVLTAAHMVFNDETLAYVSQAYWYFRREAGLFDPEPLSARGWYVLSGYAAQRTNDLKIYAPDTSTPLSRNLDVAALYFLSPVAGGGYGGYLPSDEVPNPWLTGNSLKMLVGYPVDGSEFGDARIAANAGKMYQIEPQPFPLTLAADPVPDQQVYTASWMLSYPGNSGGPLYVLYNGYYYPAGVYLGTLFNGVVPYASAVRAIDSNVVSLITNAATLGDSGTNRSGGGVITIIPTGVSSSHPAYLIMTLGPPAAVAAGAAWEFTNQPSKDFLSASQSVQELSSSAVVGLQFLAIPGWNLPPNQTLNLTAGDNTYTASYSLAVSWSPQSPIAYGTPLGSNQLNATTVDPQGNYAYNRASGTVLNAGAYPLSVTFTPTDQTDWGGASKGSANLVVSPAMLTAKAANASRLSGAPNPVFSGTVAGLQNGDNITATYSCSATSNSPPGIYSIVPALVDPNHRLANYQVTLVNGTLTVTQAVPLVTWADPASIDYGAPLTAIQLNALANVPGSFAYAPASGTVLNSGANTLSVIFTPTDKVDYGNATNTVRLVVLQAPLMVTAANASRPFGAANPGFTGAIIGLTNGDNITLTYSCSATASSPAGMYAIVPSLVDPNDRQTNYVVTLVNGSLTVTTPPVIQSAKLLGGYFAFTWSATINQTYQIQTTSNLANTNWTDLGGLVTATNTTMTTSQGIVTNAPQFYRVLLLP